MTGADVAREIALDQTLLGKVVEYVERGSASGPAIFTFVHPQSGVSLEYYGRAVIDGALLTVSSAVVGSDAQTGASITVDLEQARSIVVNGRSCTFDLGEHHGVLAFDSDDVESAR